MNSVTELPFNRFIGLEQGRGTDGVLNLPKDERYLNHLGTVHASAQLALAEASSGEFLLRALGSVKGIVPVVRRLEAKFRKPANGALSSSVSASREMDEVIGELIAKGRALVAVVVEVHDESGAHSLSASVEWFITRLPESSTTPP